MRNQSHRLKLEYITGERYSRNAPVAAAAATYATFDARPPTPASMPAVAAMNRTTATVVSLTPRRGGAIGLAGGAGRAGECGNGAASMTLTEPARPRYRSRAGGGFVRSACTASSRSRQPMRRRPETISGIKSLNFLNYILARMRAQDEGFDEAILLNTRGHIAEAATSNIFLVKDGKLVTPSLDSGILPGITRRTVIP